MGDSDKHLVRIRKVIGQNTLKIDQHRPDRENFRYENPTQNCSENEKLGEISEKNCLDEATPGMGYTRGPSNEKTLSKYGRPEMSATS
jgi:hypothetical protein